MKLIKLKGKTEIQEKLSTVKKQSCLIYLSAWKWKTRTESSPRKSKFSSQKSNSLLEWSSSSTKRPEKSRLKPNSPLGKLRVDEVQVGKKLPKNTQFSLVTSSQISQMTVGMCVFTLNILFPDAIETTFITNLSGCIISCM